MRTLVITASLAAAAGLATVARAAIVDAGALTTVTVEAPLYDTRGGAAGGCDPAGCGGGLTRDGDLATLQSRWSCKPALGPAGSTCSITYVLGNMLSIRGLDIAMYKGDERIRTIDIYVDGVSAASWTSSGTTTGFEKVDLNVDGQIVEMRGVLDDSEWLSIMEVDILVDDGADSEAVEAGTLGAVTAAAVLFDTNLSDANGCDPAGCTAGLTRDGELADTSRWSCATKLGGTCTISYDLGAARDLSELRLAMYEGDSRTRTVDVSVDGVFATTWTSSGLTTDFESVDLSGNSGQLVEVTGVLADSEEWLSIIEAEIMVFSDGTPQPAPTPAPSTVPAPPTGVLATVGLLPRANGGGSDDVGLFNAKDGDFSTSWTCTGDPRDPEQRYVSYDCTIYFNLWHYRHIKQVKIALPDGADRAVDMRINDRWNSELREKFVTSSGTTTDFETYDYDYFTDQVTISGVFVTEGESISISEVEFLEELQPGEVSVVSFNTPYDNGDGLWNPTTTDAFEWSSDSSEAEGRTLTFSFSSFTTVTAIEMQFPVQDTYKFGLDIYNDVDGTGEAFKTITNLESTQTTGWQTFDLGLSADQLVDSISIVIIGTGSGAPGFYLTDARIMGTPVDNPTNIFYVGSTFIESWTGQRYPDFVAERTGDQKAIMSAICAAKKASFDGVDCVGVDETATGTVNLPMGEWYVDGNIFMKSGVHVDGRSSIDDSPYTTDIILEDGAAGKTAIGPIVVIDGISDARIEDLWIFGQYDPETSNSSPAVEGLGSTCLSITNSQNITCKDTWINNCDGDGLVVSDSNIVNIDAGSYDDEYVAWQISKSRGTGLVVDTCDAVWVRRHTIFDNGVAGIHITGSNNFTFEATIGSESTEGEGNVGSLDGQQPIEVIVESSSLVTFQDMRVRSNNDPVMTVSGDSSTVAFNNCGFSNVEAGTCVIQTEDPSVVTADDDELVLEGTCYVKV